MADRTHAKKEKEGESRARERRRERDADLEMNDQQRYECKEDQGGEDEREHVRVGWEPTGEDDRA